MLNAVPRPVFVVAIIVLFILFAVSLTLLLLDWQNQGQSRDTAIPIQNAQTAYEFEQWLQDNRPASWPPVDENAMRPLEPGETWFDRACEKETVDCEELKRYVEWRYGVRP